MRRSPLTEEERFMTFLEEGPWPSYWGGSEPPTEPCLLWTGASSAGYGRFRHTGDGHAGIRVQSQAHRYAWEMENGPIPEGEPGARIVPDHLCRAGLCCRLSHLELVTYAENELRGFRANGTPRREECARGHLFSEHGRVYSQNGREFRRCMLCHEINRAACVERKRLVGAS